MHFQNVLNAAKRFYQELFDTHNKLSIERRHRMAVIAGVGQPTPFRLESHHEFWGAWARMTKVTDRVEDNLHREGDGSVPLASAWLENLHQDNVRFFKAEHAELPNRKAVYEDVLRFLNGQSLTLPKTPKGALEGHLGPANPPSSIPHLDRSADVLGPKGRWDDALTLSKSEDEILHELESGQIPGFSQVRIL